MIQVVSDLLRQILLAAEGRDFIRNGIEIAEIKQGIAELKSTRPCDIEYAVARCMRIPWRVKIEIDRAGGIQIGKRIRFDSALQVREQRGSWIQ